jgi:hypothetical protein
MKKCSNCKKIKELRDFFKNKSSKDGYSSRCKECASLYWLKPKEKIENDYKRCTKCKKIKHIDFYTKKKTLKSGLRSSCKECDKKYREQNKDNFKIYRKDYLIQNSEKIKKQRSEYFLKNKEKIYFKKKEYKKKNTHIFAWKSVLRNTLKRMGSKKEGHTIDILGYSAEELKKHLELKFTDGMNWNNYGQWHIDHNYPVSKFDRNTPVSIVCALENLKPMWATDREINGVKYQGNLNKSNTI